MTLLKLTLKQWGYLYLFNLFCQSVLKASFLVLCMSAQQPGGSQILFQKLKRRACKLWKCGCCCSKTAETLSACDFHYSHINLAKYLTNSVHALRCGVFSAFKSGDYSLPWALHPLWQLLLLWSLQNSPVGQRFGAAETQYADFFWLSNILR